jgi:hypothetical protein
LIHFGLQRGNSEGLLREEQLLLRERLLLEERLLGEGLLREGVLGKRVEVLRLLGVVGDHLGDCLGLVRLLRDVDFGLLRR